MILKTVVEKHRKLFVVSVSFLFVCLLLLLPPLQNIIIKIAEMAIGRTLRQPDKWHKQISFFSIAIFALYAIVVFLVLYIKTLPKQAASIFGQSMSMKNFLKSMSPKERKHFLISIVATFMVISGILFFYISKREVHGFNGAYTVAITNRGEYGLWGKDFESGVKYLGKDIKEMSFYDDASLGDALSDVVGMWYDNRDSPHSNFYYTLSRLWFVGVKTSDFASIIFRGLLLNLIFYAAAFYFLLKIILKICFPANLILHNPENVSTNLSTKILFCAIPVITFLNGFYIFTITMMREYSLQTTCLLAFSYVFICYFDTIKNGQTEFSRRDFLASTFCLSLLMLSGYYTMIYIAFLGLVILLFVAKKSPKLVLYFCALILNSLVMCLVLYRNFFAAFKGDRGKEAFGNFHISTFANDILFAAKEFWQTVDFLYMPSVLFLIFIVAALVLRFASSKHKKDFFNSQLALNYALIFWAVFILIICPDGQYAYIKYTASLMPLFSLFVLNQNAFGTSKKVFASLHNFLLSAMSLVLLLQVLPLNKETVQKHAGKPASYLFLLDEEIPVVVQKSVPWKYEPFLPDFLDYQNYYFVENLSDVLEIDLPVEFWFLQAPETQVDLDENFVLEKTGTDLGYGYKELLLRKE